MRKFKSTHDWHDIQSSNHGKSVKQDFDNIINSMGKEMSRTNLIDEKDNIIQKYNTMLENFSQSLNIINSDNVNNIWNKFSVSNKKMVSVTVSNAFGENISVNSLDRWYNNNVPVTGW